MAEGVREQTVQAIGLLSGGLDSILAIRVLQDQGLAIEAMHGILPVHDPALLAWVERICQELGVPLYTVDLEEPFFELLRRPRYGYGSGMNPCIDCHILLLKRAAERMQEVGAAFVFTGEVLGERPMSQHREALRLVERKSGLEGYLLRPLSARLLPPTIPEQQGLVDREKLLDIQGRSRKPQMALAQKYGLQKYPSPAGGCRLTDPGFARRARDLLAHHPDFTRNDFELLKVGRHFRLSPQTRVVSGRTEAENRRIVELAREGDLLFEVKGTGSPVTLLRGPADATAIALAAAITARYADARAPSVRVHYGAGYPALSETIVVEPAREEVLAPLRI